MTRSLGKLATLAGMLLVLCVGANAVAEEDSAVAKKTKRAVSVEFDGVNLLKFIDQRDGVVAITEEETAELETLAAQYGKVTDTTTSIDEEKKTTTLMVTVKVDEAQIVPFGKLAWRSNCPVNSWYDVTPRDKPLQDIAANKQEESLRAWMKQLGRYNHRVAKKNADKHSPIKIERNEKQVVVASEIVWDKTVVPTP